MLSRLRMANKPPLALKPNTLNQDVRALLRTSFVATWVLKDTLRDATANAAGEGGARARLAATLLAPASQLAQVLVLRPPYEEAAVYAETGIDAAIDRTLAHFLAFLRDHA